MSVVDKATKRRFLAPFAGQSLTPPPIWLMRQAGRYLPEYRAVRAQGRRLSRSVLCAGAGGRGDAAADPALWLRCGDPVLGHPGGAACAGPEGRVRGRRGAAAGAGSQRARSSAIERRSATRSRFGIVCETVARLRQDLPDETALIGFCGAPWTVATYMVAGRGTPDQADARLWAYRDPKGFAKLIDLLVEVSIDYLSMQAEAGADALQIFDTWAGSLPPWRVRCLGGAADCADRRGGAGRDIRRCPSSVFRAAPDRRCNAMRR